MRTWDGGYLSSTAEEIAHQHRQHKVTLELARIQDALDRATEEAARLGPEQPEADLRAEAERAWAYLVAGDTAVAFAAAWPRIREALLKQCLIDPLTQPPPPQLYENW